MNDVTNDALYRNDIARCADGFPFWNGFSGCHIVITGATGLIGSYLVDLLTAAPVPLQVTAVGRSMARLRARFQDSKRIRLAEAHRGSETATLAADATLVIHAGSNATPQTIGADPVGTMRANLSYLDELLEGLIGSETAVLYISSSEVYGRCDTSAPLTEDQLGWIDLLAPRSCYPSSKRAAETLAASYAAQHGVRTLIARPAYIFGPSMTSDDNRVIPQFVRSGLATSTVELQSTGAAVRSYCYVADCATALLTIAARGSAGVAYNVADALGARSIRQLAETVASHLGATLVAPDRQPGELAPPPVLLDATRLESLGWQAAVGVDDGLRITIGVAAQTEGSVA